MVWWKVRVSLTCSAIWPLATILTCMRDNDLLVMASEYTATPSDLGMDYEDLYITTADGVKVQQHTPSFLLLPSLAPFTCLTLDCFCVVPRRSTVGW